MSKPTDLGLYRHKRALDDWLTDCKRRMNLKRPKIDFESEHWPIKTLYQTDQQDWYFSSPFACFASKDTSFFDVIRGLVAEMVLKGTPKTLYLPVAAFCSLAKVDIESIFKINLNDLKNTEDLILTTCRENPASAIRMGHYLSILKKQLELLAQKGVISWLGYRPRHEIKVALRKISLSHEKVQKAEKSLVLDRKIEAFNDALNALYDDDPRLDVIDRMVIALTTRLMCAPSRINENLCSSIDDHVTIEDYTKKPENTEFDQIHRAHQMLLMQMKGSKGASWGAKPALNFMIYAFNYTLKIIIDCGKRSRMLVNWYLQHPDTLYLPSELEYLRGKDLRIIDLAKIVHMTERPSKTLVINIFTTHSDLLSDRSKKLDPATKRMRHFVPFKDAEQFLLQRVHLAMEACRRVTSLNHYKGDLSKILVLCDRKETPYIPWAVNDQIIRSRLSPPSRNAVPSLFQKLGITMPIDDKVAIARIETHDPRRWLITQAERHGEKLSDALIKKWANRLSLAKFYVYDLRSPVELAESSAMPLVQELVDLSKGIEKTTKLEEAFGLKSQIVNVPDAGICVTSMKLVMQAVDDRPVARTSEQIIILYPSQFGICLHQHHETPCRNYNSCLPCDSDVIVKGHQSSNDEVRSRSELLHKSIIRQIDRLMVEHNRGIADDQESITQHILNLVENGLNFEQMADYLIDEFHQIKDMVKDKLLVNRLEEAFVARGFVKLLDDKEIPSGALIKYHNHTYHASPGLEKALDSHGGRDQIFKAEQELIEKFPQFAPKALQLKDERYLLTANDDCEE
ncbi:hypothetical protein [Oryzomonas rubra]|uniref:Uncharacterized protein n=1 Tax=Oryzomonas rubra TaxID=2509454 RepID=A0A5A9XQE4_9BACT|nr:hypothetical protein [Oryzomonas rubra]KAA0894249.1 hypothetical protein ET418_04655 [Oryzomonas rubra]